MESRRDHFTWKPGDLEYLGNVSKEIPQGSTEKQAECHLEMIEGGWLRYDRSPDGINVYRHDKHPNHAHVNPSGEIVMKPPGPKKFL